MSTIPFEQIPFDMKTQLNNLLAAKKKEKVIKTYEIKYIDKIISFNYPQTRQSTCLINIKFDSASPYHLKMTSRILSKKSDTERDVAYSCYNQLLYDMGISYKEPVHNYVPILKSKSNRKSKKYWKKEDITFGDSDPSNSNSSEDEMSYLDEFESNGIPSPVLYPLHPVIKPSPYHPMFIYILVDLENKPHTKHIESYVNEFNNVKVLKFVGVNHPQRKNGNVIVKSCYKDAADHAISMYVGGITETTTVPAEVIIYTGDRFASGLQEICQYENINVYHMAHTEDIIEFLSKYNYNETSYGKILCCV